MKQKNKKRLTSLIVIGLGLILATGCTKNEVKKDGKISYGSIADCEGNLYKTVTIGTQTWMGENLKVTKYNDGTTIPNIADSARWSNESNGALCDYDTISSNSDIYGKLYNWYAVHTGKLCPTDWHVPNNDEWTILYNYLGGEYSAGGKIKATDTIWHLPNICASNETGFNAFPSGHRDENGVFNGIGYASDWWSDNESDYNKAWFQYVNSISSVLGRNDINKKAGFSVRCIKD